MASDGGNLEQCVSVAHGSLKQAWQTSLQQAIEALQTLHTDASLAAQWRLLPAKDGAAAAAAAAGDAGDDGAVPPAGAAPDAAAGAPSEQEPVSLAVLRRHLSGADVYRATWEHACDARAVPITGIEAVLQSAVHLPAWMPVVEGAEVLEVLGPCAAVVQARFKLGWPTSPRDAILLTYLVAERDAVVFVATSVPRTAEAPSYLRPAPPYVRAAVHLAAVVAHRVAPDRLALASYWAWDLHGTLLGMRSNAMLAYLPRQLPSLVAYTAREGRWLPLLASYGTGIEVTVLGDAAARGGGAPPAALSLAYTVLDEDEGDVGGGGGVAADVPVFGADLGVPARTVTLHLPSASGWAVRLEAAAAHGAPAAWRAELFSTPDGLALRVHHARVVDAESYVRVQCRVERAAAEAGVRVNGAVVPAEAGAAGAPLERVPQLFARLLDGRAEEVRAERAEARVEAPAPPRASPLAALVRRNYIYFTSLLQEPEAKWRPVADARGVTVTQLDSIDATLVVYRAEATFVGVGVWDFFSTLRHASLARRWDAQAGDVRLVADVGGQSSVWHTTTRATWTTYARDAVLVETAYTAPASVHLFAFSADAAAVPGVAVPEVPSGAVRTQVDLRGWSIEALSPTTVHVTLLEQSDPGGWLRKTSLPAAMIQTMAGVGEYTIHHGGPPLVTRLLHARVLASAYDDEQSTYTLAYAPARDELADDASDVLEAELRCSMDAWAPNLDVAVTPAPRAAACLHRHRLSLGGGGLWLTLEHDAAQLGADGRVEVVVRKGPAQSRERHVVLLNGTRMHVDTDDLDAAQVQQLARQKRTKPRRVPLDFPPAARGAAAAEGAPDTDADGASDGEAPVPAAAAAAAPAPRVRHAMQPALDALFLLRRLHSERHPDPAGVPAGWALVSERGGLYVRRKLLESLSPTVAVQRADQIVPGVAAEELVHLVSNVGCRALWDERMGAASIVASYGSGAHLACWTSHGTFPFRPRLFVVGSVTACGRHAAPASPSGLLSPTSARQPVYFHASASCDASAVDVAALNAQQLPVGRVLIDGWILETLDPYSSAQYPIPSTRATHVVAVDYGGAMPTAVNALWNAALPRALGPLAHFLQTHGPPPFVHVPPAWMEVGGDGHDDDRTLVWTLQRPARRVGLLTRDFGAATRTLDVRVALPAQDVRRAAHALAAPPPWSLAERAASPASPTLHRVASRTLRRDAAGAALVVVDAQLELQHYPQGYALDVAWDDAPAPPAPLDLSAPPARAPSDALPLRVRVYDRPPSALQAATRDAVDRSHKHLVRVTLPAVAPDDDDGDGAPLPPWAARLRTHGAVVRVVATPLAAPTKPVRASDTGQVPVTCNGKVAEIVYGDEAARVTAADAAPLLDRLERVARPGEVPTTPVQQPHGWTRTMDDEVLRTPLALAHALLPAPAADAAGEPAPAAGGPHAADAGAAAAPAAADAPDADASAGSGAGGAASPAPMFGLLRTPATLNHTLSSMTHLVTRGKAGDEAGTPPRAPAPTPVPAPAAGTPPPRAAGAAPQYRRATVVLVAIVSFLLGSLLRSFVQPADFVLVPRGGTDAPPERPVAAVPSPYDRHAPGIYGLAAREVEGLVRAARLLNVFGDAAHDEDVPTEGMLAWREIRRFLDVRIARRWDVIVALVHRFFEATATMQSDDVVWSLIGHHFCSYKIKSSTHQTFCRNEYNLTGLCNRQSCPLANSRYATVREKEGVVYLYIKTPERAHAPRRQWERVRLSNRYSTALEQIDKELVYWPNFVVHKAKQRLTKITQYLIKLRKIKLKEEEQPELVGIKKKTERREATRELKALRAAKIEKSIEKELLDRLKRGAYGDAPLNVNEDVWNAVLENAQAKAPNADTDDLALEEELSDEEAEEDIEEMERNLRDMEEDDAYGQREFVSDDEESDDDSVDDIESDDDDEEASSSSGDDDTHARGKRKGPAPRAPRPAKRPPRGDRRGARPQLEVEYERETEPLTAEQVAQW
ncbi:hypothetical protein MBRA1_003670 [Malassezia brasiliensis]|uniref:START domain-containing protein n=1 Tax=Malassezia brasiliensis TaxID=1821822 RepID=A0AAF0IQ51_9BASI|nr:hypothetical protein MBRA1_003670 [Malassezia brasiliensis]